jgi:hypothetical protein
MRLWIDDKRPAPGWASHHAKTPYEAIAMLKDASGAGERIEHVAFDHDLGTDGLGVVWEVKPVVRWMAFNGVFPETASIHTSNPWGRQWLEAELRDHNVPIVPTPED